MPGDSTFGTFDPRDNQGGYRQRNIGQSLGGALTGIDAFSDINSMRDPHTVDTAQQIYRPDDAAFQIQDNLMGNDVLRQRAATGTYDPSQANQWRGQQQTLAQALADRAYGQAPSLAQMQTDRSLAQSLAAQRAMAASARGTTPGMAARLASQGSERAMADASAAGTQARLQEQMGAEQNLGSMLAGARGQDISQAGAADTSLQNWGQAALGRESAQQQALAGQQNMIAQQQGGLNSLEQQRLMYNADAQRKASSGIVGMAGSALGSIFSDERTKENVSPAPDRDLREFLARAPAKSFEYRGSEYGPPGQQYGVMAQDLERSKVGRTLVQDTPEGKTIDVAHGFGAILAAQRDLHERLSRLEGRR